MATSPGSARRRHEASSSRLASRAEVAATAFEVSVMSVSSTFALSLRGPTINHAPPTGGGNQGAALATRHRPAAAPPPTRNESGLPAPAPVTFKGDERPGPGGEWGEGLGLPRLPAPFHRVYSPPEAPKVKARRSGVVGAIAAVVAAVALAAVGVFAFARGDARPTARPTSAGRPGPPGANAA